MLTEAQVQRQILDYLANEPRVAMAWRQNSGAVMMGDNADRKRFVRFSTAEGASDILGFLDDGRFLAIEVKRQGWKAPTSKAGSDSAMRYRRQLGFVQAVRDAGGVAGFATCYVHAQCLIHGLVYNWHNPNESNPRSVGRSNGSRI